MTFVSAVLIGGLANRIFIINAAIAYANKTKRKFVLIPSLIIDNAHESTEMTINSLESLFGKFIYYTNDDYNSWRYINDPDQNAFAFELTPPFKGESVIFQGYFQNPKYFLDTKPPQQKLIKRPNTYFLHIRLGDYVAIDYYQIPLKKYYSEAIIQIIENDIDAKFLVFSNDNTNAAEFIKTNIKVPFDYTFSQAQTALDTLTEMASCAGAICTNSSLSWMGAYYQGAPHQNIYMPYPWANTEKKVDIYPDWATVIDLTE
jgi:hypothetical protein